MEVVNEQTTAYLTVTMLDKNEAEADPNSATYAVHDKDAGTEIIAPTAISASGSQELTMTPTINTILNPDNLEETRVVTIEAIYGAADHLTDAYEYRVKNLAHVS